MTTTAPALIPGHTADCDCVKCLMADMDAHLKGQGLDPFAYAQENILEAERTRYATPGAASGRGTVRKASAAQVGLIKRLMAERVTTSLVRLPGSEDVDNISLRGASDLIERLMACPMKATATPANLATPAQVGYAVKLAERKGLATTEADFAAMGRRDISQAIDMMKGMADAPKTPAQEAATVTEGMYRDPATGDIFKVQVAHHGSGNLYAKKLVKLEEPTTKRGKEVAYEFQYATGAIRRIQPEWKMTLEEAKEWGQLYGVCCRCGAILTDEKSQAKGIGPWCEANF